MPSSFLLVCIISSITTSQVYILLCLAIPYLVTVLATTASLPRFCYSLTSIFLYLLRFFYPLRPMPVYVPAAPPHHPQLPSHVFLSSHLFSLSNAPCCSLTIAFRLFSVPWPCSWYLSTPSFRPSFSYPLISFPSIYCDLSILSVLCQCSLCHSSSAFLPPDVAFTAFVTHTLHNHTPLRPREMASLATVNCSQTAGLDTQAADQSR